MFERLLFSKTTSVRYIHNPGKKSQRDRDISQGRAFAAMRGVLFVPFPDTSSLRRGILRL
jgi:hypothetical protein